MFYAVAVEFGEEWAGDPIFGYDIALLKLNRDASFTTPRLAHEDARPSVGDFLGGLGWGATASGESVTRLQYVSSLRAITHEMCNEQWARLVDKETMVCAGIGPSDACRGMVNLLPILENAFSRCSGDSGGPLLQADSPDADYKDGKPELDLIYGIISFGDGVCGNGTRAGVYTYIGYFQKWILSVIEVRFLNL